MVSNCGTYCRGGPPWLPSVEQTVQESSISGFANTISTEGGHRGPPLQFAGVPEFVYALTKCAFNGSETAVFLQITRAAWALPQALATLR